MPIPATLQAAADDAGAQEQAAFEAAVDRVAPAVVRIETIGGLEQVEGVLIGTGPTTGLVVDPSGYIISSAFNFVGKPASILVRLPGGQRKPARLVATDHSRMLVLLKIDADKPLPTCQIVPRGEMRVGQWTIAVGRTFDSPRPNMAVGILSALDRVWGKAIQTDAAVSPNNYGGPLVDVRGRVLGVLVAPLARKRRRNRRHGMVRFGNRIRRSHGTHPADSAPAGEGRRPLSRPGGHQPEGVEPVYRASRSSPPAARRVPPPRPASRPATASSRSTAAPSLARRK